MKKSPLYLSLSLLLCSCSSSLISESLSKQNSVETDSSLSQSDSRQEEAISSLSQDESKEDSIFDSFTESISNEEISVSENSHDSEEEKEAENPFGEPQNPVSEDFLSLFDISSNVTIKINLPANSASFINTYQSDKSDSKYFSVYVPCDISFNVNGAEYGFPDAGIRMKGNTSRAKFLDNRGRISRAVHFKVSFKATFDDEIYDEAILSAFKHTWDDADRATRKDRNLFGLEKIDLKYIPRNNEGCDLLEAFAYSKFREASLLCPYAGAGKVITTVGTSSMTSDYEIIEIIDKEFLKRRMSKANAKGDLYKCVYGPMGKADLSRSGSVAKITDGDGYNVGNRDSQGKKIGVEDDYNNYHPCYDLKTNDNGEASDFSKMAGFINSMWSLVYANAPVEVLESALDTDYFAKFAAITYLFGNFDDQRYNANNYYLYFLPSNGKAYYIPYDWDWCLGLDSGRNFASRTPFDKKDIDGYNDISNNVYGATILNFGNANLSYSLKPYQDAYAEEIVSLIDAGLLNPDSYTEFASKSHVSYSTISMVSDYLNGKKVTALNNLSH